MTIRSLIFSPHEVRAALEDRLVLVVRPVKPQPEYQDATGRWTFCVSSSDKASRDKWSYCVIDDDGHTYTERGRERCVLSLRDPFGVPGTRLFCRESWKVEELEDGLDGVRFKVDESFIPIENTIEASDKWGIAYSNGKHGNVWRSPATMPAWASRITMEVVGVRCVQAKDLTEDDARACGSYLGRCSCSEMNRKPKTPLESKFRQTWCHIHGEEFQALWESKYGTRYPWDTSWAWAVEVRRVRG